MAEEGSGLEQTLTKGKVGGIPVWGIGIGFAGVIIAYFVWRNHLSTKALPPAAATDTTGAAFDPNAVDPATGLTYGQEAPAGYGLPSGSIGTYLGDNPTYAGYPVGLPAQGIPGPITNQQWSRLAFDELVAKGDDPTLVGNALAKFLAGTPLTTAEQAIVSLAETIFGAPPEGLIPIDTTPPTDTPPGSGATPGAVTGASARPTSPSTIDIWWQPLTGVRGYTAWIRPAGSTATWDTVGTTFGSNITARGLKPGTAYEAVIRANTLAGYGPYSDIVHATTPK